MFTDSDREIFTFQAGPVERRADPLAVDMRLVASLGGPTGLDRLQADLGAEDIGVSLEAVQRALPAICDAFKVTLFEDDPAAGVTVAEALDLLNAYLRFRDDLEKKRASSPVTSPPTGSPPAGPSATPSFAGLGSTGR